MATIKYTQDGSSTKKIILKNVDGQNVVSCECCVVDEWMIVDFEPKNNADGSVSGSICNPGFFYSSYDFCWCEGGIYDGNSSRQLIETNVGAARADGVWSSSVNFDVKAHLEYPCETFIPDTSICDPQTTYTGSISVTYKGVTKSQNMNLFRAERGSDCTIYDVSPIITVYSTPLGDGSYFEIV
jgi:hypothetical protein